MKRISCNYPSLTCECSFLPFYLMCILLASTSPSRACVTCYPVNTILSTSEVSTGFLTVEDSVTIGLPILPQ
uniref:Secreted protein n=1 Tax=Anguilla anguilla TaxID=7936 RepID=A0A0E9VPN0_ANGAN